MMERRDHRKFPDDIGELYFDEVFDIEKMDSEKSRDFLDFLYRKEGYGGPKKAKFASTLKDRMYEVRELFEKEAIGGFAAKVLELMGQSCAVPEDVFLEIVGLLKELVPDIPEAIPRQDVNSLGPVTESIWDYARKKGLEKWTSYLVYRWYEHQGRYEEAIEVLKILADIDAMDKNRLGEATCKNNLAFDLMMMGRCAEGAVLFDEASRIFLDLRDNLNYMNSRANYWLCRIGEDGFGESDVFTKEVSAITEDLGDEEDWRSRKPYIILARLAEKKGDIDKAVLYVEKAISAFEGSGTKFLEKDRKYLESLKTRLNGG